MRTAARRRMPADGSSLKSTPSEAIIGHALSLTCTRRRTDIGAGCEQCDHGLEPIRLRLPGFSQRENTKRGHHGLRTSAPALRGDRARALSIGEADALSSWETPSGLRDY